MKRIISLSALLLFAITSMAATITFTIGDFTYSTTTGSSTAKITKYNGAESYVSFPTSVNFEGTTYQITAIEGGYNGLMKDDPNIEELFIPLGISSLKNVTRDSKTLKTIVIEDGTINIDHPFTISSSATSINLNNIIVLSSCNFSSIELISNGSDIYLYKAGEIKVSYHEDLVSQNIQMYLFDKGDYNARPFGKERFDYLLSALQKSGKDISKITKIDLSSMNSTPGSNRVLFKFDNDNDNPSSELSPGAEVIISGTESYTAINRATTIIDKENYTAPQYNVLTNISYNRTNTYNWNSVCLPFDIKESYFVDSNNPNGYCKIYTVTAATNNKISLTRVETPESTVKAGTPCFIYSSKNDWDLNISNVTISYNVAPETLVVDDNWAVIGSFSNETIGTGKYKLNSEGSEFGITNSNEATVTAFRCYIAPTSTRTNAPAQLSVNIEEEASITLVPNDAEPQKVKLYDLMGRPRKEGSKGFFIKSTR